MKVTRYTGMTNVVWSYRWTLSWKPLAMPELWWTLIQVDSPSLCSSALMEREELLEVGTNQTVFWSVMMNFLFPASLKIPNSSRMFNDLISFFVISQSDRVLVREIQGSFTRRGGAKLSHLLLDVFWDFTWGS